MYKAENKYYYLLSSLPELRFGQFSQMIDIQYYFSYIHEELQKGDSEKARFLFYPYDNRNLVNICLNKKADWNLLGNYNKDKLIQLLNESSPLLPDYLNKFYDDYLKGILPDHEFMLQHEIAHRFYDSILPVTDGFIHNWLVFNRDFRNILVGMSIRQNHYVIENQFIGDGSVVAKVKTDTSSNFGLQADFPFVDYLMQLAENNEVVELEKQIDFLRWSKIDELSQSSGFSFDSVAAFMAKLIVVYRWSSLNLEKGKKVIQAKLDTITEKLKFSQEFNV